MRNAIFAFLTVLSVAGISACDSGSSKLVLPDLSMKMMTNHDLTVPMTGCSGFLDCIMPCTDGNCQIDCYNNTTSKGQMLADALFVTCPASKFCDGKSDAGDVQCTSADMTFTDILNDTACIDCLNALSTDQFNQCSSQANACLANKP
jgi:hypothetical protein